MGIHALKIPEGVHPATITGHADENLRKVEDAFGVRISLGDAALEIEGDDGPLESAILVLDDIVEKAKGGQAFDACDVQRSIELTKCAQFSPKDLADDVILTHRGHACRPKTTGQKRYIDAIRSNTITFGIGPAGTGKTYLAMAMAIASLDRGDVARIVLSRPIIEAGESLGFLPGTLNEKVDPYIRPLYDALFDMMDAERAQKLMDDGTLEIAPLAFMRGRTLNDSFIILDEAQNATSEQMKMFLTRLGYGSKMAITGDLTQSDLPSRASGLKGALDILDGLDDISIQRLGVGDVVRNSLVQAIINAYEEDSVK